MRRWFVLPMLIALFVVLSGCSGDTSQDSSSMMDNIPNYDPSVDTGPPTGDGSNPNDVKYRWDVPGGGGEIHTGCLGRDCIPALTNPELISASEATQLKDDDLVLGFVYNESDVRAYPLRILDWHEVINQDFSGASITITYCPLTGTAVGIDVHRTGDLAPPITDFETELSSFGVSGFLYNNNLIPYDRGTFSNWSQMLLQCVNGPLRGTPMATVPLIETSWATWKKMFPDSRVVSDNTGFDRPYDIFPYGRYKTDPFLLFPIMIDDARLPRKERVHGIVTNIAEYEAKTYPFSLFDGGPRAINDDANGLPVVVAGWKDAALYISYLRTTEDGTVLTFEIDAENPHIYPFDLIDNEGTVWNVLGEAVAGPRQGQKLKPTTSYNGYWFAFGTFFPNVPIFQD